MPSRADYISVMEKIAEEKETKPDNHAIALEEVEASKKATRETLSPLFKETGETSLSKKFPGSEKKESGHPFTKVAFFDTVPKTSFFKTASPAFLSVAYNSFQRELDKINGSS